MLDAGSELVLLTQAFPIQLGLSGSLDIDCGLVDPNTGKAACSCDLQSIDPIAIPSIGFTCLTPEAGCPPGEIDCDGGNDLDVDVTSDHNIGACTSNADCASQCVTFCGLDQMEAVRSDLATLVSA